MRTAEEVRMETAASRLAVKACDQHMEKGGEPNSSHGHAAATEGARMETAASRLDRNSMRVGDSEKTGYRTSSAGHNVLNS